MNWLKRKVIKWVNDDSNQCGVDSEKYGISLQHQANHRPDTRPILSFRIYSAQNGDVLEFSRFDNISDRSEVGVYIISKETNLGEFVSKCITLELLK
jgi:hypothetical protein